MNLETLNNLTAETLKQLFDLSSAEVMDWHPLINSQAKQRPGNWYQSDVCDRLSAALKCAPSSIAHEIQKSFAARSITIETDSRGFLFISEDRIEATSIKAYPDSVLVYVQPPEQAFTLYYAKYISQLGIQLEFLKKIGMKGILFIPSGSIHADCSNSFDITQFYGVDGFVKLLEILRRYAHVPSSNDLTLPHLNQNEALILWLSMGLLSVTGIGSKILDIRKSLSAFVPVSFQTVSLSGDSNCDIWGQFNASYQMFGFSLIAYLAQLEHALDLDWQTPQLENALNISWLLKSVESRMGLIDRPSSLPTSVGVSSRLRFLSMNLYLMQQRVALRGDSSGLLLLLRELCLGLHESLNRGNSNNLLGLSLNLEDALFTAA